MYYLCEKYYKPIIVQCYIADCVSWVPRLTSLDLQIGLNEHALKRNSFICRGLTMPPRRDRCKHWHVWGGHGGRQGPRQAWGYRPSEPQPRREFIPTESSLQRFTGCSRERLGTGHTQWRRKGLPLQEGQKPHLILLPQETDVINLWDRAANLVTPIAAVQTPRETF